jgi:hypothetical protein
VAISFALRLLELTAGIVSWGQIGSHSFTCAKRKKQSSHFGWNLMGLSKLLLRTYKLVTLDTNLLRPHDIRWGSSKTKSKVGPAGCWRRWCRKIVERMHALDTSHYCFLPWNNLGTKDHDRQQANCRVRICFLCATRSISPQIFRELILLHNTMMAYTKIKILLCVFVQLDQSIDRSPPDF